jgi:hypothetical protein
MGCPFKVGDKLSRDFFSSIEEESEGNKTKIFVDTVLQFTSAPIGFVILSTLE